MKFYLWCQNLDHQWEKTSFTVDATNQKGAEASAKLFLEKHFKELYECVESVDFETSPNLIPNGVSIKCYGETSSGEVYREEIWLVAY